MSDSWWTVHAQPSAARTAAFYAEALLRASQRVNKPEKAPRGPGSTFTPRPKAKKAPLLPTEPKICAVCGDPFSLNLRGPQRVYCSHRCNQRAWKARRRAA